MNKKMLRITALCLAAAMTIGTAAQASAVTSKGAPPNYEVPVNSNIITLTAHRSAVPLPEMLGANVPAGYQMINGGVPTSVNAFGNFTLEIWGSPANNVASDPYWCNYYFRLVGGAPSESATLINLNVFGNGNPTNADTLTISDEYGGVSVSLYRRPDVLLGVSSNGSVTDDTGYDSQLAVIAATGEYYSPSKVKYHAITQDAMIATMYDTAACLNEIKQKTGKATRYSDPEEIAQDYENYIKGIKGYIKEEIGEENYRTIAIVSSENADGTYTIHGQGATSATSPNYYVEYTEDVANNLADILINAEDYEDATSVDVTGAQLATADAIILTGNSSLEETVKNDAVIMAGDPEIISMNNLESLYGVSMNSVENALGMGYVLSRIYDNENSVLAAENVYKYFASKFYHIKASRLDYIYELALLDNVDADDVEYADICVDSTYDEKMLEQIFDTYAIYY